LNVASSWKLGEQDLETVPCPACGGSRHAPLASTDRYDMGLRTVGCEACGMVYTQPQPTTLALDTFYREHYRHFYQGALEPSEATIKRLHKDKRCAEAVSFMDLCGTLKRGLKVLDVGASEGVLLRALGDAVPTSQRYAVEPNAVYGAFAVQHAGCRWFDSLDSLRTAGEGGFDLITMVHVFEHVKQPVQQLRELSALLAPGGAIYIDVPDVTTYAKLNDLHIAHLLHFGPDTLRRVATVAGLKVQVLERHIPIMHPRSLHVVLRPEAGVQPEAPHNLKEGWAQTRRAGRHVWAQHRRRWPWWRRIRHMISGRCG
jgi:2-polyprenyl-3-methyl-5-hydroxy-6-metoxy-1,4-benzoquinol methylase